MYVSDRCQRWRQPDHRVIIRTGVHAEPVQLVNVGQPSRRWRRRRTPPDAAHEPNSDQPATGAHTDSVHERPDEPHVGRLLSAPANASTLLHVVLIVRVKPMFFFLFLLNYRSLEHFTPVSLCTCIPTDVLTILSVQNFRMYLPNSTVTQVPIDLKLRKKHNQLQCIAIMHSVCLLGGKRIIGSVVQANHIVDRTQLIICKLHISMFIKEIIYLHI